MNIKFGKKCFEGCTNLDNSSIELLKSAESFGKPTLLAKKTEELYQNGVLNSEFFMNQIQNQSSSYVIIEVLHSDHYMFENLSNLIKKTNKIKLCLIISGVEETTASIGKNCFDIIKIVYNSVKTTRIGNSSFCNFTSLRKIIVPYCVEIISEHAFSDCSCLSEIIIPSSYYLRRIESYAFEKCSSLKVISIPSSLEFIGSHAFSMCTSLSEITIPSSVTKIGSFAFSFCTSLVYIEIPSGIQVIECSTFTNCTSLKFVKIPYSVIEIHDYAFNECSSLTVDPIPSHVRKIGKGVLSGTKWGKKNKQ